MALPALELLARHGCRITLVGRPWAAELFAAYPWAVIGQRKGRLDRIRGLRALSRSAAEPPEALLLTNSFSSALEFRLAGLRAVGYATDARRVLLRTAIALSASARRLHMVDYYFALGSAFLELPAGAAPVPALRVSDAARDRASAALARAGSAGAYIVVCPVAVGLHHGKVKCWDGFGRLARELALAGQEVVLCPGPGEHDAARQACPDARLLEALDVEAFGALLAGSRLVVANDSGSGHLAAACGAPLVGVFGVTDPTRTRPRSDRARVLGDARGWPSYATVREAVWEHIPADVRG